MNMQMIQKKCSATIRANCVLLWAIILSNGCTKESSVTPQPSRTDSESAFSQTAPVPANLQIVLEGPFAIQTHLDDQAGKIKILIPKAPDHFDPGFDADLDQHLLCNSEFSVDLPGHSPGLMKRLETKSMDQPVIIDTVEIASVPNSKKFASVVIDKPDEMALLAPTDAAINGPNGGGGKYATKVLLRYVGVDPNKVEVQKLSSPKEVCEITPKLLGAVPIPWRTISVHYPYHPEFVPVGSDGRLLLSMVPSVKDDQNHKYASASYTTISSMLGIKRTVTFPRANEFGVGPHNDCRAPQILVNPVSGSGR
jgi:hypothetical protein